MIVAHQGEHAAVPGRTGKIRVTEDVAGAVDARSLAVPDAEHAIELALTAKFGLLRAPKCGGRKVLIQPGLENDVVFVEEALCAHELLIEPAKRRAAIAGDVACSVEPRAPVPLLLHETKAD